MYLREFKNRSELYHDSNAGADSNADATADSTDSKKTWSFKSFSRITPKLLKYLTGSAKESPDALNDRCRWFSGDSPDSKNHPGNHYLKIAILLVAYSAASATDALNDLKIQLRIFEEMSTGTHSHFLPLLLPLNAEKNDSAAGVTAT